MDYAEALAHACLLKASVSNIRWNGKGQRVAFVPNEHMFISTDEQLQLDNGMHKAGSFVLFGVTGGVSMWTPSVFDLVSEYEIVKECGVEFDPTLLDDVPPTSFFKMFSDLLSGKTAQIQREGWNGRNMALEIKHFIIAGASQPSKALICLRTPTGEYYPYVPPVTDIVATDWQAATIN